MRISRYTGNGTPMQKQQPVQQRRAHALGPTERWSGPTRFVRLFDEPEPRYS